MEKLLFHSDLPASPHEVFAWHARRAALRRLTPPWTSVELISHEGLSEGSRAKFRLGVGPLDVTWIAEHENVVPGEGFTDRQVKGPFKRWRHDHLMEDQDGGCRLTDRIEYELPFSSGAGGLLGNAVRGQLARQFAYRHRTLANDLMLHGTYSGNRLRVAVTGASGLIGRALVIFLESGGHEVLRIVRRKPTDDHREVYWNHREDALETEKLDDLDAVIHLAGESALVPRWSQQKKMEILSSRVGGTQHLATRLADMDRPPAAFLSSSAIGYYGDQGTDEVTESSLPGDDGFLSAVCQEWEQATKPAEQAGIRTVHMRIGIVLSPAGGILPALLLPFKAGLGGRYGGRNQYLSWVGIDDVLGQIYRLLHEPMEGPVNLTAPNPVTMVEFAETLGRVLSRPTLLKMPPGLIRLILGEVAEEAALMSVRAVPRRLQESGYDFLHPTLESTLRHVLGRTLEPFPARKVSSAAPAEGSISPSY